MNKLYNSDCLILDLDDISLIYIDPPYSDRKQDIWYGVGENLDEYLKYMEERLIKMKSFLSPNSNILVHVDYKAVHYLKVMMDSIFGMNNFCNEIIWCFSNPSVASRYLPRKHQTILWYGLGSYPFNQPKTEYNGKLTVGGKTSWSGEKKDEEAYVKKGKSLEDWWTDIPALCRNEKEKLGYATQKPIKLMERIVQAFSNEGDRVFDGFMGSGTFLEAAVRLKRFAIGCDVNPDAYEITKKRLSLFEK